MLGQQASGKTTFVAALWAWICDDELLDDEADRISLRINGTLPAATQYLDEARFHLLRGRPVPRTATDTAEDVRLDLLVGGKAATLHVLDLSGESLERLFSERSCPKALADHLTSADCLMLFVHPNEIRLPATIADATRMAGSFSDQSAVNPVVYGAESSSAVDSRTHVAYGPTTDAEGDVAESAPTAVQLVDLTQIAAQMAGASAWKPLHVCVVVSAWDVVDPAAVDRLEPEVDPRKWLFRFLPLLAQFLEANRQSLPSRVFGVSAQGGDYEVDDTADRLACLTVAKRAVVVDEGPTAMRDIAAPLHWLLDQRS
ncbi:MULTISPECIES: hypothetical protein [unclassified Micromonospora]|uniref:TRAFAC clade GTPase domain-containing protein n=1 Tax=unclassified Micromonospora TaxID=2617518 RepID=UPI00362E8965